jgi:hypothetical protein
VELPIFSAVKRDSLQPLASELSCVEILRGVQTFLPLVANRQRLEKR